MSEVPLYEMEDADLEVRAEEEIEGVEVLLCPFIRVSNLARVMQRLAFRVKGSGCRIWV